MSLPRKMALYRWLVITIVFDLLIYSSSLDVLVRFESTNLTDIHSAVTVATPAALQAETTKRHFFGRLA